MRIPRSMAPKDDRRHYAASVTTLAANPRRGHIMNRLTWSGWLIAGLLLLQNAAPGLAASANGNPLEGHLLQDSNSTLYLYHGGLKFTVHLVDMTDQVIDAIPTASSTQWDALFTSDP